MYIISSKKLQNLVSYYLSKYLKLKQHRIYLYLHSILVSSLLLEIFIKNVKHLVPHLDYRSLFDLVNICHNMLLHRL